MKLDLTQKILTFKNEPFKIEEEDLTLGTVIAESLAQEKIGSRRKLYILSHKAFTQEEMEVDEADLEVIKKALEGSQVYGGHPIIFGQALTLLDNLK